MSDNSMTAAAAPKRPKPIWREYTEALLLADRIAVMQAGRLCGVGSPAELMAAPPDDYVRTLMEMPKRQADRVERLAGGDR